MINMAVEMSSGTAAAPSLKDDIQDGLDKVAKKAAAQQSNLPANPADALPTLPTTGSDMRDNMQTALDTTRDKAASGKTTEGSLPGSTDRTGKTTTTTTPSSPSGTTPRGSSSGGGGGTTPAATTPAESGAAAEVNDELSAADTTKRIVDSVTAPDTSGVKPLDHVSTEPQQAIVKQMTDAAAEQSNLQIDKAVNDSVLELQRNQEDAAVEYQNQRNQVNADEQRALDNQALYAEARGDRGGIGQSQYGSVQNAAAVNRQNINLAQEKLATDTARQIEDLRANGEFQKADALLTLTQNELSQLLQLEQWALEQNISIDQVNNAIEEWKADLELQVKQLQINTELSAAQLTGSFSDGTPILNSQEQIQNQLASAGAALIQAGIKPSAAQIEAMGYTEEQVDALLEKQKKKSSGGGSSQYIIVTDENGQKHTVSVSQYQKENGLPVTGTMDGITTTTINNDIANNGSGSWEPYTNS